MVNALATLQPHSDSMTNLRSRSQATPRTSCTTVLNFDPPFQGRFRSLGSRTCRVVTLMSAASRLWPRGAKCLRGPSARPLSPAPYESTKTRKVSRFRQAVPRCATYPALLSCPTGPAVQQVKSITHLPSAARSRGSLSERSYPDTKATGAEIPCISSKARTFFCCGLSRKLRLPKAAGASRLPGLKF